jgi:tRNA-splicing ligase RtcB
MGKRIERLDEYRWRLPREGGMHVDGVVFANDVMMEALRDDPSLDQVRNVAHLPGIVGPALAMPDIHWGYGFPIGGVAATDAESGVVSPGGVGYDINCGVRLLSTTVSEADVRRRLDRLVATLFDRVPTGVGAHRRAARLGPQDLPRVLAEGARWAVEEDLGVIADLERLEAGGRLRGARPGRVSSRALERGSAQLGSLGSGNHFAEVQCVDEVYAPDAATAFGLELGTVTVMIHSGSRGLGHQVCEDHLRAMVGAGRKYGIELPDRQLACAPLGSAEADAYLEAMAAAANFAFANRQVMAHRVREAFASVLGEEAGREIATVYDVCHNIAKFETLEVDGRPHRVCVHRKGATRAYPPEHPETPEPYRAVGQPVIVPGDMGRYSFVLAGTERAMTETLGSSCHGAGRRLSRSAAKRAKGAREVLADLEARGVVVRAAGLSTVAEEMPEAYKDVADVVGVMHGAGITRRVARLRPLGVIKG